jgi:hypothetical protein
MLQGDMSGTAQPDYGLLGRERQLSLISEFTTEEILHRDRANSTARSPVSPIQFGSSFAGSENRAKEAIDSQTQTKEKAALSSGMYCT